MTTEAKESTETATKNNESEIRKQFPLETRIIKTGEEEVEFDFRVIDSPDKWLPASEFKFKERVQVSNQKKSLYIDLRGISYSEWMEVELKYEVPDAPEQNSKIEILENYKALAEEVYQKRHIECLELSTGKKIPGKDIKEKIEWMQEYMSFNDDQAFFDRIIDHCSAVTEGALLGIYNQTILNDTAVSEVVDFKDFNDLISITALANPVIIQRPFDNFLTEFPLKSISGKLKTRIEKECKAPLPPGKPGKNPITGIPDPNLMEYNYNDPSYRKALRISERKKTVMLLDACLPFNIPGDDIDSKFKWVGSRLLGDVVKLRRHIEQDILGYSRKFNFFTIG